MCTKFRSKQLVLLKTSFHLVLVQTLKYTSFDVLFSLQAAHRCSQTFYRSVALHSPQEYDSSSLVVLQYIKYTHYQGGVTSGMSAIIINISEP